MSVGTGGGESKVARHERIKGAVNPWEILDSILSDADGGPEGISKEDFDVRLRWWGVYPQGDGMGVRGGSTPYFMIRIRIPGGRLTVSQFRTIGRVSRLYARNTADITVRQNIQLHWVSPENLRPLFEELGNVGLTTQGACGDDTRNITCCPVSDLVSEDRKVDMLLLDEVNRALNGNPLFYNLPRKFKITFAGCPDGCTYPEINDVGILPVHHPAHGEGYALRVGGGLATRPHLSLLLPRFFPPDSVLPALLGIATLFRDREELRQSRERARLKFLFLEHGWTVESFAVQLEGIMGRSLRPLDSLVPPSFIGRRDRDHLGFHPERRPGLSFAGIPVPQGLLTPERIDRFSDWAESLGKDEIRLTPQQNLIIPGISEANRPLFEANLLTEQEEFAGNFRSRTISCTGKTFCRLALAETKELALSVSENLDREFEEVADAPFIQFSGCPNDCGQMRIADIGLSGIQGKNGDHGTEDGFELLLGGSMQGELSFNRRTGVKLLKDQVGPFLTRLIAFYRGACQNGEDFRSFIERTGFEWVKILDKGTEEELVAFALASNLPGGSGAGRTEGPGATRTDPQEFGS